MCVHLWNKTYFSINGVSTLSICSMTLCVFSGCWLSMSPNVCTPDSCMEDTNKITLKFTYRPTKAKRTICISDYMQSTFFLVGKFPKTEADDQCSSITKGNIYYMKHKCKQPFTTVVDWPEIWCLKIKLSMNKA